MPQRTGRCIGKYYTEAFLQRGYQVQVNVPCTFNSQWVSHARVSSSWLSWLLIRMLNVNVKQRSSMAERKNVPNHVFICLMKERCRTGGEIFVERGTGYTNSFKHIKRYVADGDINHLVGVLKICFAGKREQWRSFNRFKPSSVTITGIVKPCLGTLIWSLRYRCLYCMWSSFFSLLFYIRRSFLFLIL